MATIVILEHLLQKGLERRCLIYLFAEHWREAGHTVLVHYGTENLPPADIAVLHVDLTVVPAEYAQLVARYPRVINGAVLDIGKRGFSSLILDRNDSWEHPVIVKTDVNDGGRPELRLRLQRQRAGEGDEVPAAPLLPKYQIFSSLSGVPEAVWMTPGLIVEKFVPEQDDDGYYVRIWVFFGDRERNTHYRSDVPVIKSGDIKARAPAPVPDELRAWRQKLKFDFGKFDYVCPGAGPPILLDVNRTPSAPRFLGNDRELAASFRSVSEGIDAFLR